MWRDINDFEFKKKDSSLKAMSNTALPLASPLTSVARISAGIFHVFKGYGWYYLLLENLKMKSYYEYNRRAFYT